MTTTTNNGYIPVAWHHFEALIPAAWEITAYAMEARLGRMEFSTRDGLQAVVSWESCKRQPLLERTLLGFFENQGIAEADVEKRSKSGYAWGICPKRELAHAITFFLKSSILLRWTFEGQDPLIQETILDACQPNQGDRVRYAAFGLDLSLPADFEIEDAVTQPANVMLGFESAERVRIVFRRWGLPAYVLGGHDLDAYLENFLKAQGGRVQDVTKQSFRGHEGALAHYAQRGQYQMDRFMGRLWPGGIARLWLDQQDQRMYGCQMIAPPDVPLPRMEALWQ